MNPQSATMPAAPHMANDVASPAAAPTPAAPVSPAPAAQAATNVVTNIPVHTQQTAAAPANEDAELDKIMQDVGHELKKEDNKPQKHGFLGFSHKPKPLVKVAAQPVRQTAPMPAQQPVQTATAPAVAMPAAVPKAKIQRSIPVFVIFVAFLVTGFLVAAAIAAYRQT
jgi:hypothetical protein